MPKHLINDHDQFLYNGDVDTGHFFRKGEPIPEGYVDRPNADSWDNPPLPPDQWPDETEPEPEPDPIVSEPNYVEPKLGDKAPRTYRTVTPEEQAAPEQTPAQKPEKFDPFPVTNDDLMKLRKHELVEILSIKGINADDNLHIAQLRSLARKAYVK